jgi:hypothetical protein
MLTLSYQCLNIILTTKALMRSHKAIGKPDSTRRSLGCLCCMSTEAYDYRQMKRQVCSLGMPLTTKMKTHRKRDLLQLHIR